ncbi:drug efflux protein [Legionella longbeachae]|nr:integral membrane protein, TerC family [Legionella oakridgensis RV-2-2007]KTD37228.1 drug efflux protein [Legionella oakridgensis]STY16180.1 drug efflux protein [Legionella longbeachae]
MIILSTLAIDAFLFGGKEVHRVSTKEALAWSIVWFLLAIVFNALFWWYLVSHYGHDVANKKSIEFFTGYLIEKSLSVDNVFVFLMMFHYFAVPLEYQRRVLLFGVLGAIVMRLMFILLGVWLVSQFHWILYLFGIFLVITGIKMFLFASKEPDLAKNPVLRWMRRYLRITKELHQEKLFIRIKQVLHVTPLLLVLVLIETSDLIFALDSIPAIFAVTEDPFIILTSNIFAILGLRALYFLLANMVERFYLLKYGLAFILVFIGSKMLIAYWVNIPVLIALSVVVMTLVTCMVLSIFFPGFMKK